MKVVPTVGIDPTTLCLVSNRSSTGYDDDAIISQRITDLLENLFPSRSQTWFSLRSPFTELCGQKVALHAGFEPAPRAFREPCSAVELMERMVAAESLLVGTYVGDISIFIPISIFGFSILSIVFLKNFQMTDFLRVVRGLQV